LRQFSPKAAILQGRQARRGMIAAGVGRIVDLARRNAAAIAIAGLVLSLGAAFYAATHLAIDTDLQRMLPTELAWRQNEIALDQAFPQNNNLLVIVIDGQTGDLADRAARQLADRLRAEPELFGYVRQPDGGAFFDQNGLLFLPVAELETLSEQLIAAQPLIGNLARDPSLRGLFDTLAMFVAGAGTDQAAIDRLNPTLAAIGEAVIAVLEGRSEPFSWQQIMTGRAPDRRDRRRFVLARPVLDFTAFEPGARARAEIRRLAGALALDPPHGVRLRMTGPVALDDEQFATLREGALRSTILSVVLVCAILFAALRSMKLVGAILATLAAGLALTAGFAALAIGSLNPISVAFGVLFIGLAVDFSIQFSVRYRDQRHRLGTLPAALRGAGESIGPALVLAAGATAIGFLSFVPTRYTGIRELGWIAGSGMLIAIALNFLLLPSVLALLRPRGEPEPIGFRRAAPLDRFLLERRGWVIGAAALLAAAGLALLPRVSFDFDPLNLKDPRSESVATARDLMQDPMTTPYTAEILAPSLSEAERVADRLGKLPEVAQTVTAASFIPGDQDKKLEIISDLTLLLGPTLTPGTILPPPRDSEALRAIAACRDALEPLAALGGKLSASARLAGALDQAAGRGAAIMPALRPALLTGLKQRLAALGDLIRAQKVTLASLPPELRDSWIAADGRTRIEVFPQGDARDPDVLSRFVTAIRTVAPDATGTPVTIQEAGRLISSAFVQAGVIAIAGIALLLALVLHRPREIMLVIAPLLLAAILTLAIAVLIGMPLNYANIIALPLLLGIGVAFDIYFVMNWRAGQTHHLQSSTARAVVFSALTTMSAFGSLALSNDPGTAQMGELLAISLACTLFCTLFILPALLGPAGDRSAPEVARATRSPFTPPFRSAPDEAGSPSQSVIPGLVPGIHVDGRDKPGHDG
jgi:hopanoid biosynthesis associated RND transporter like protein HpnN